MRRRLGITARMAGGFLLLLLLASSCVGGKQVIRLHAWESDSHFLNNALAEFIIESGYGFPVETVVETTPVLMEALPKGEVDLNLEGWQQNIPNWYQEHITKGNIVNLGMTFEGGPQFFIIPKWVAEEYGIETVEDMQEHWRLFQDPQDPSKGVFYNCLIGQECAEINEVKLEAYGLSKYYNPVTPGSQEALEAVLARSQKEQQPVFGFYWEPNSLMRSYEWHILEEPSYTPECWEKVTAAGSGQGARPIDQACAYETIPIDKLAHKGLLGRAPDVVEMLRKMNVGLDPLNDTLAWTEENSVQDWKQAAIYYLQTYEARWRSWVTPDAYEKIKDDLEDVSG